MALLQEVLRSASCFFSRAKGTGTCSGYVGTVDGIAVIVSIADIPLQERDTISG
jgi:hypothetical protein